MGKWLAVLVFGLCAVGTAALGNMLVQEGPEIVANKAKDGTVVFSAVSSQELLRVGPPGKDGRRSVWVSLEGKVYEGEVGEVKAVGK